MGFVKYLGANNYKHSNCSWGYPHKRRGYYTNAFAIDELLRYVTRTRENETRQQDLKCYGVFGAAQYGDVREIIRQFQIVQQVFQNNHGRKMYHIVFTFDSVEEERIAKDYLLVYKIGQALAYYFWNQGFQILFAVHDEEDKHLHIHLAMNSVNFMTGKKFHISENDEQTLKQILNDIASNILAQYRSRALYQQM